MLDPPIGWDDFRLKDDRGRIMAEPRVAMLMEELAKVKNEYKECSIVLTLMLYVMVSSKLWRSSQYIKRSNNNNTREGKSSTLDIGVGGRTQLHNCGNTKNKSYKPNYHLSFWLTGKRETLEVVGCRQFQRPGPRRTATATWTCSRCDGFSAAHFYPTPTAPSALQPRFPTFSTTASSASTATIVNLARSVDGGGC